MKETLKDFKARPLFDNIYTPARAIDPLLKYIPVGMTIWECADLGTSVISQAFRDRGDSVISTDVETGFDFLKQKPDFHFDTIVTNPPYSKKDKFIRRCYEYNRPFALLLPLTALEGRARGKMFGENGISLIVLNQRIDFTGKGAPWFAVGWFCYRMHIPPLVFESLDEKSEEGQLQLFTDVSNEEMEL